MQNGPHQNCLTHSVKQGRRHNTSSCLGSSLTLLTLMFIAPADSSVSCLSAESRVTLSSDWMHQLEEKNQLLVLCNSLALYLYCDQNVTAVSCTFTQVINVWVSLCFWTEKHLYCSVVQVVKCSSCILTLWFAQSLGLYLMFFFFFPWTALNWTMSWINPSNKWPKTLSHHCDSVS